MPLARIRRYHGSLLGDGFSKRAWYSIGSDGLLDLLPFKTYEY